MPPKLCYFDSRGTNLTMKHILAHNIRKYERWLDGRKAALPWVSLVKQRKVLHGFIMKMMGLVVLGKKGRSLNGASMAFARTVVKLYQTGGNSEVVYYFKKCQLLLMQSISSRNEPPILRTSPRVATTGTGLPRIIPVKHREMIRKGNSLYIQLWMTLFNIHRILPVKGKWKIDTIFRPASDFLNGIVSGTDGYVGPDYVNNKSGSTVKGNETIRGFTYYLPLVMKRLQGLKGLGRLPRLDWKAQPLLLLTQGPNSVKRETSFMCMGKDALAWAKHPLYPTFKRFLDLTGNSEIKSWIEKVSYMVTPLEVSRHDIEISWKKAEVKPGEKPVKRPKEIDYRKTDPSELEFRKVVYLPHFIRYSRNLLFMRIEALGKLSSKVEKGGKIRVFASVDYWTQIALKPLHDWIFSILKLIPQDATFHQGGSVKEFASKLTKRTKVFSYDLSAATDRLPMVLQVEVLSHLIKNPELAVLWGLLLVGRPYFIKRRRKHETMPKWHSITKLPNLMTYPLTHKVAKEYVTQIVESGETITTNNKVMYSVGQPMGALTSWASLAITHHFIVQIAALQALPDEKGWFSDYLVLGDDIIIANEDVALRYKELMTLLEVPMSNSKGIESDNGSFEFAKEFYHKGKQCSPFSWAEIRIASQSLSGLINIFLKERRWPNFKISHLVRMFGFGYQVASRLSQGYLRLLRKHPRVLPLLFIATFPDTTPVSRKSFSDWIRTTSIANICPESDVKDADKAFSSLFLMKTVEHLKWMRFHVDSLKPYIFSLAPEFLKCTEWAEGVITEKVKKDTVELAAKFYREGYFSPRKESVPPLEWLDKLFEKYVALLNGLDSYPNWITPTVEESNPNEHDKMGRWCRFKLKTCIFIQKKGKVPWDTFCSDK